ncbi:hypothetical protein ACA910_008718 [Epithemia clementina (nom. ined.)]
MDSAEGVANDFSSHHGAEDSEDLSRIQQHDNGDDNGESRANMCPNTVTSVVVALCCLALVLLDVSHIYIPKYQLPEKEKTTTNSYSTYFSLARSRPRLVQMMAAIVLLVLPPFVLLFLLLDEMLQPINASELVLMLKIVLPIAGMLLRRVATPWIHRHWVTWLETLLHQQQQQQQESSTNSNKLARLLLEGGPLGRGCAKLIKIVVGLCTFAVVGQTILPRVTTPIMPHGKNGNRPIPVDFASTVGSYCRVIGGWSGRRNENEHLLQNNKEDPTPAIIPVTWWQLGAVMLVLSLGVNGVLWLWSTLITNTTATTTSERDGRPQHHEGVRTMVQPTVGRTLTATEQSKLTAWALLNALCEEVESRGLNRAEFQYLMTVMLPFFVDHSSQSCSNSSFVRRFFLDASNLWQALVFGLLHYHGIPSGWSGVGLTLVYGWIMGLLAHVVVVATMEGDDQENDNNNHTTSLTFPIVTHAVADYFIFAYIARRQLFQRRVHKRD